MGLPWDAMNVQPTEDWEFTSAADDSPAELYALYDGAVERSRTRLAAALADGGLDQLAHLSWPDGVDGLTPTFVLHQDIDGARDQDEHLVGVRMSLAGVAGRA